MPDVPGFWVPDGPGFRVFGGFLELMSSLSEESSNESLKAESDSMAEAGLDVGIGVHGTDGGWRVSREVSLVLL